MFVNRHEELARLQERQFFVLYGRRRVGKTELLREFCRDKAHIFFIATLSSDGDQLAAFSQQIWRYTHAEVADGFTFPTWEAAFGALVDLSDRAQAESCLHRWNYRFEHTQIQRPENGQ